MAAVDRLDEVLALKREGLSNREVGRRLGLSAPTIGRLLGLATPTEPTAPATTPESPRPPEPSRSVPIPLPRPRVTGTSPLRIVPVPAPGAVEVITAGAAPGWDIDTAIRGWSVGLSDGQVAAMMGQHPQAMSDRMKAGEEDARTGRSTEAARWWVAREMSRASTASELAARVLELTRHPDPKIALKAAQFWLERCGGGQFAPPSAAAVQVNVQQNNSASREQIADYLRSMHARREGAEPVRVIEVGEVAG